MGRDLLADTWGVGEVPGEGTDPKLGLLCWGEQVSVAMEGGRERSRGVQVGGPVPYGTRHSLRHSPWHPAGAPWESLQVLLHEMEVAPNWEQGN